MRSLYIALLAGCASAGSNGGDDTGDIDASVRRDSSSPADSTTVDGPCMPMTKNLLRNGNLEASPAGADWAATPIVATAPIVTDEAGGVPAQSPAFRAWMGGVETTAAANKDVLHQDVAIPMSATKLEFKGFYDVRTGEIGTTIYDRAIVELTTQTNTQLELIKALDDNGATTAWTAFAKTFSNAYAGMTVRLRFSSASDSIDATSFFYDTLELNVTFCQ